MPMVQEGKRPETTSRSKLKSRDSSRPRRSPTTSKTRKVIRPLTQSSSEGDIKQGKIVCYEILKYKYQL